MADYWFVGSDPEPVSEAAADPGAEAAALRAELEETNRGLLAVYAELSEQREQLEQARSVAVQASQTKAAFLANMSHEIRSPLNAVIGFTSLLLDTALSAEQVEYAEMIRTAGNHLRGLIDDILDLSKIDSGRLELENIPFDLVTCVEEAVGIVASNAEEKGLALVALFAADTPVAVMGDPVRLRQILVNLLSNAVKFTGHGQVVLDVTTEPLAGTRSRLAFHVTDTGIGIPAQAIEKIFGAFTQADASTTRNFGGTGLGLAICRQLSEGMGGGIGVRSKVGVGSTFTCTIEAELAGPTRLDSGPDRPLSGTRVLVVHHQPIVAEAIGRHLRTWGAEVTAAATVNDALRAGDFSGVALAVIGATRQIDELSDAVGRLTAYRGGHLPIVAAVPLALRSLLPDSRGDLRAVVSTPVRRAQLRAAVLGALGQGGGSPALPAAAHAARPARVLRVLLAEDNPVNQRVAQLMLERLGHRADLADDGEQAVAAIAAGDYDLVLMDLHMPRLDGLAAAREARRRRPGDRPRIVALTASATEESRRACLAAGMDGFLTKPVEPADLARILAAVGEQLSTVDNPGEQLSTVDDSGRRPPSEGPPSEGPSARRVLYVDDDSMIIALVERILARDPGVSLVTAATGGAAIERATADPPDVILLDLNLPDMSGHELLGKLRADPRTRSIPAVVVTGDVSPATRNRIAEVDGTGFLGKPFDPVDLRAAVRGDRRPVGPGPVAPAS